MAIYFDSKEFSCRCGCGLSKLDPKLIEILDVARAYFGRPIIISSGCRCQKHNAAIGGAINSAHLIGPDGFCHAVDIKVIDGYTRWLLFQIFDGLGIKRFEVSNLHLHIDNAAYLPHPMLTGVEFKDQNK